MKKLFTILLFSLLFQGCKESEKPVLPNIVIIFADDLGYGDITSFGATGYETPNIDKMGANGLTLTHFYAVQAVCSASRAGLLTGCYPNRIGISGAYNHNAKVGINPDEMTLAELVKQKGYATGVFGKWHLGHLAPFLPLQNGFDEFAGLPYSNDMWPVGYDGKPLDSMHRKSSYPPLPFYEGNEVVKYIETLEDQDQLTKTYTEKALQFIQKNKSNPFLLYLPHSMPHVPLGASENFKGKSEQGLYGDVVSEIDWSVGEIIQELKNSGIYENTIVIFTSDNGPWLNYGNHAGSTGGLREGKGTSFEGGQRVPCIIQWPTNIGKGITSSQLSATIDLFPTIASLIEVPLPENKIDGVDISSILKGDVNANPRNELLYYYNYNDLEAVRKDNWKLVLPHHHRTYEGQLPGANGFPGLAPSVFTELALYDLRRDPGEEYNVLELYPDMYKELMKLVVNAREDLGDFITENEGKNRRKIGQIDLVTSNRPPIKHLGLNKKVHYDTPYSIRYPANGEQSLTDGHLGSIENLTLHWQGFREYNPDFTVELEILTRINTLSVSFLENTASWIFGPENVSFFGSIDGKQYELLGSLHFDTPSQIGDASVIEAKIEVKKELKYIKVKIQKIQNCPDWHPGHDQLAWLFADELKIQ